MDDVSGAWPRKDVDEFVFSKFPAPFTTDFITEQKPRLCLTLAHPVTLDDMCGPFGKKGRSERGLGYGNEMRGGLGGYMSDGRGVTRTRCASKAWEWVSVGSGRAWQGWKGRGSRWY